MEILVVVGLIYAFFAFIGIYRENRRQTDALERIAKALEHRNVED